VRKDDEIASAAIDGGLNLTVVKTNIPAHHADPLLL
jgi:hypothetical protein